MEAKSRTRGRLLVLAGTILAMAIAVWMGGRKKWELMGIGPETTGAASLSSVYQEKLLEHPNDPVLKYNLAYFSYQQNQFKEAEKQLSEIVNAPDIDWQTARKAYYNLGNVLFRMSEKSGQTEQALSLLTRSLQQYRAVLDGDRELQDEPELAQGDEDAAYNYALVKQRMKILADKLEQERKRQQQKKELFTLLKELLEREIHLQSELAAISGIQDRALLSEKRNLLLKEQAVNLKQLDTVRERIMQVVKPGGSPPVPSAPTI